MFKYLILIILLSSLFLISCDKEIPKEYVIQFGGEWTDTPKSIKIDSQNNIYILGVISGDKEDDPYHIFLSKYNIYGEKVWIKKWSFEDRRQYYFRNFYLEIDKKDNIYISIGSSYYNSEGRIKSSSRLFRKFKPNGEEILTKKIEYNESRYLYDNITFNSENNIISIENNKINTINDSLELLSSKEYNKPENYDNHHITFNNDNMFIFGRIRNPKGKSVGIYYDKYDKDGILKNEYEYFLNSPYDQSGVFIKKLLFDKNNNLYLIGSSDGDYDGNTNGGGSCDEDDHRAPCNDFIITKFDSLGNKLWSTQFGDGGDQSYNGAVLYDENIYILGTEDNEYKYQPDLHLFKLNLNGEVLLKKIIEAPRDAGLAYSDKGTDMTVDDKGNLYILGYTDGSMTGKKRTDEDYDIFFMKLDSSKLKAD